MQILNDIISEEWETKTPYSHWSSYTNRKIKYFSMNVNNLYAKTSKNLLLWQMIESPLKRKTCDNYNNAIGVLIE